MAKVKQGWENNKFWGYAGKTLIKGRALGELSQTELQAIYDADPRNASRMIEPTAVEPPKGQPPTQPAQPATTPTPPAKK